jgi:hypothetical protein
MRASVEAALVGINVDVSTSQLSAFSRLFSSAVFREMAAKGKSRLFARLIHDSHILDHAPALALVRDAFEAAFDILKQGGYRDEYIYKAALTHRILLGTHSLRTACMLSEFRAGECKADIAILNGTTTVYEIKSERDSLSRLGRQIENYRKVFASVFVIAGENHVDAVLSATAPDVGVMSLSRRYQIRTRRGAKNRPERICPLAVFEALRTCEASAMLINLGHSVPNVPNTALREEMRKRFETLRPAEAHEGMLRTLKQTRNMTSLAELVGQLPNSLQAAALSVPLRRSDHQRLLRAVETPLKAAMAWT